MWKQLTGSACTAPLVLIVGLTACGGERPGPQQHDTTQAIAVSTQTEAATQATSAQLAAGRVSRAVNEHGLALGQVLGPAEIGCEDGGHLVIGDTSETQLLTFASFSDCSACEAHMSGLDALKAAGRLPAADRLIVWRDGRVSERQFRRFLAKTPRRVCAEQAGAFWDRYDLKHTPVTLVLRAGRIVYLHDMPLASNETQESFLSDIRHFWPDRERVAQSATTLKPQD